MPTAADEKTTVAKEKSLEKSEKLPKGMELDHYGPGGVVQFVSVNKVEFLRDIGPFFEPTFFMIMIHVFYYFFGNLAIPYFFGLAKCPINWLTDRDKHKDKRNISLRNEKEFFKDKRFFIPMFVCVAMGTFNWIWCLCLFSDDVKFNSYYFKDVRPQTWQQKLMLFFALGFMSSMETSCAHEAIHRREWFAKGLGMFSFSKIFYLHFKDVHVQVHHKLMATPEDPFYGAKDESFYYFMAKELYQTYMDQVKSEIRRIKQKHGNDCPLVAFVVFNKMTLFFLLQVLQCVIIYLVLGKNSLKYHFIHALAGYWFLGFANYVTHYGLKRNKDKNGLYESINKYHSWNFQSNLLFWRLPRHSDHHNASFRPVQIVRRIDDAPWIPYQFTIQFFLVHIPPLWKWVMNPRADAANDFNSGRENKKPLVSFTLCQPKTVRDILTERVVYAYITMWTVFFFYFAFMSNCLYVISNTQWQAGLRLE